MTEQNFETVLFRAESSIAFITLNRPKKLNAVSGLMIDELVVASEIQLS